MVLMSFASTLAISLWLVITQRWHGRLSHDDLTGVQKIHHRATPRVGGLGVMLGLLLGHLWAPPNVQVLIHFEN